MESAMFSNKTTTVGRKSSKFAGLTRFAIARGRRLEKKEKKEKRKNQKRRRKKAKQATTARECVHLRRE
jgi:RecA/RadA recombinase